jgi:hypothetical protein
VTNPAPCLGRNRARISHDGRSHNLTMQLAIDPAATASRNLSGEFRMTHLLGLAIALLLLGGGVWANVYIGSLSQEKGAWVAHSR